ncbi:hypothetical protein GCM10022225_79750 [Plantactinospora mayteni]|uniref:Uncharacterized protein n=1 Tax=Plantactinospora mayteni TaxID=566021 RepID=A0ABQ4F3F4_9ACTN|nr:hypothetical protein [Plantactinospora mayteni]GIH01431.1 hypothetical protein Pma05_80030 [Plantactinospora mayteni]
MQITVLTAEVTRIDAELADFATTCSTLPALAAAEFTAEDPTVISSAYQQPYLLASRVMRRLVLLYV